MSRSFLLLMLISPIAVSKVYKPCELAQLLYQKLSFKYGVREFFNDKPDTIPILVCIAAYHHFNSSSIRETSDGTLHQGIFGIVSHEPNSRAYDFQDDNIDDDLEYFIEEVLHEVQSDCDCKKLVRNELIFNFYKNLCESFTFSHEEYCYLNDYVFGNFPVFIPDDKNLLFNCHQNPNENGRRQKCLPRY